MPVVAPNQIYSIRNILINPLRRIHRADYDYRLPFRDSRRSAFWNLYTFPRQSRGIGALDARSTFAFLPVLDTTFALDPALGLCCCLLFEFDDEG